MQTACTSPPTPWLWDPNPKPCFGRDGQWDQKFAEAVHFTADPVIVDPDVTELLLKDEDEFVIIASDGLWCAP